MLTGQEITLFDSLLISVTGLTIVMLVLCFLAGLIVFLTKVLSVIEKGTRPEATVAPAQATPIIPTPSVSAGTTNAVDAFDEELAVIATTVCEHHESLTGEQVVIKSIVNLN